MHFLQRLSPRPYLTAVHLRYGNFPVPRFILDVLRLGNDTAGVAGATVKEGADGRRGNTHFDVALLCNLVTQNGEHAAVEAHETSKQVENTVRVTDVLGSHVEGNAGAAARKATGSSTHVAAFALTLLELT